MTIIDNLNKLLTITNESDDSIDSLLVRLGQGEHHLIDQLYNLTQSALYGFILSIVRNPNTTQDVMQETYLAIIEHSHQYHTQGKPMAWIFTIARNQSYQTIQKNQVGLEVEDWMVISEPSLTKEESLTLQNVMTTLSEQERQIIMLHTISGYKHHEIAKALQLPLSTVLSKYHRAMHKLKKQLSEDFNP